MKHLQACMGGWCQVRSSCGHYHAEDTTWPADRMCRTASHESWIPMLQLLGTPARETPLLRVSVGREEMEIGEST